MIVLVGASASGKTELAKQLYQSFGYKKCITTTTRKPRINEKHDVDYHFLSTDQFRSLTESDAFYEITEYNGHFYGIQKRDVNPDGVVIVDPHGANTLIQKAGDLVYIVYVETSEEIRKRRMMERKDDMELIRKRLENDRIVFRKEAFLKIDLHLYNETHTLLDLAYRVHQSYQYHLKK
ncbi:MAG: AAA family ATPase [Acholeplasmataceae bacterium]|jgi:guanylate kinase|nr:AAA family ATPase [Acholeplasmataceae bacterium]